MNYSQNKEMLNEKLTFEELKTYLIDCVGLDMDDASLSTKSSAMNYIIDIDEVFEVLEFNNKI